MNSSPQGDLNNSFAPAENQWPTSSFHVPDLILKKRENGELTHDELAFLIRGFTQGTIPDYQIAAFLMAVCCRQMSDRETTDLTLLMASSGKRLDLSSVGPVVVDKHSTGGVGDKVTLIVAPLVAACGVPMAKMSGRGLGHTGGTIDKLEAVSGFRSALSQEEFLRLLKQHSLVLSGQSEDLAPADGKLYALRDVTATIDNIPLIASSIMSKKLAIGATHILLDVKVGSGAFMKTVHSASLLAQSMVSIGRKAGRTVAAIITDMSQPLGRTVGNSLEVAEAIATLQGNGPADLTTLSFHEVEAILLLSGRATTRDVAHTMVKEAIADGRGLEKFAEVIAAQGGDRRQIEDPALLPHAPVRYTLTAPRDGYIAAMDALQVGLASLRLGAGRVKKGAPIDPAVGLVLLAKVGDAIQEGSPLVEIHARKLEDVEAIIPALLEAYRWNEQAVQPLPLIRGQVN